MRADLGAFSAAELRAGGINERGFLQPVLPAPAGVDPLAESKAAAQGLASRGLLARHGNAWRAVGRFERLLEAAAAARSLLAVSPAEPDPAGPARPRLMFGCLGRTDCILDLDPVRSPGSDPSGYRARLLGVGVAAAELAEYAGLEGGGDGAPAAGTPDPLATGMAAVRVEAASIGGPEGPLRQHRLSVITTADRQWLLVGSRYGARAEQVTVALQPGLARGLIERLLRGEEDALRPLLS